MGAMRRAGNSTHALRSRTKVSRCRSCISLGLSLALGLALPPPAQGFAGVIPRPAPAPAAGKEDRGIFVVGLNTALQRGVLFSPPKGLEVGRVNRAAKVGEGVGGKGQNVCAALRRLAERGGEDISVTLAQFCGGRTGAAVSEVLKGLGVRLVSLETAAQTRTCTSLVDERFGETTEITEPWSGQITDAEQDALVGACSREFAVSTEIAGMAFMGSIPSGVRDSLYAEIMQAAAESPAYMRDGTRVMVDSIDGVLPLIGTGHVDLLKVNTEELLSLAEKAGCGDEEGVSVWMEDKVSAAAAGLFASNPCLSWIAVTNGPLPAYLFSHLFLKGAEKFSSFWRYTPPSVDVVSPIGAGDATAAATLSEWTRGKPLPEAFRVGLAAGCAACLSVDPVSNACFSSQLANKLISEVKLEQVQRP
ncbi:unnamed protein product [Discosporangium mesarthrocarpum]